MDEARFTQRDLVEQRLKQPDDLGEMAWVFKVVSAAVVDGDTFDAVLDLGFGVWKKERFRLLRCNAPERGQPGWSQATDALATMLINPKNCYLWSRKTKRDKYGRYLADVWFSGRQKWLSDIMLASGLVEEYLP
jgi:endonuclease YncB( thermonuclease family)